MATLSSSGAFTGLAMNLTPLEDAARPAVGSITPHPTDLATLPDEIRQTVRVFQAGWGALIGSNKQLDHSATCALLIKFLQAYMQAGVPRSGDRIA